MYELSFYFMSVLLAIIRLVTLCIFVLPCLFALKWIWVIYCTEDALTLTNMFFFFFSPVHECWFCTMDKKSFQRIVRNKVFLIDTLTVEADFILQNVQQAKLITPRDYRNLSDIPEREKKIINLLDKLMGKGEETCRQFIDLLKQDCILENFPTLKDHAIFDSPVQEVTFIFDACIFNLL